MNCKPIPTLDERINDIRGRTAEIVNNDIIPNEGRLWASRREGESFTDRTATLELRADIKEKVKKAGLWAPHLPKEYGGMGLDFMARQGIHAGRFSRLVRRRKLYWPNASSWQRTWRRSVSVT